MLLPLHLDNSEVRLFPVACVVVAVLCVVVHVGVSFSAASDEEVARVVQRYRDLARAHPEAILPKQCVSERAPPDPRRVVVVPELERACTAVFETALPYADRRYGIVPSRGVAQIGFLTSIFLHASWSHLLGNLLFFYIVGPFLEDRWGRGFFSAFFVIGGVVSGLSQALVEPMSTRPIIGASGAIAACMGAFTLLFWRRRVFVLLWLGVIGKKFYMPAWLWGCIWIGGELFSYALTGLSSTVAVLVHIGGFFFGLAVAYVASKTGLDQKLDAAVERSITHETQQHAAVDDAEAAFARGDWAASSAAWARVLKDEPKNPQALFAAARAYFAAGERARAAACFDRFVDLCVVDKDTAAVREAFMTLAPLGPDDLRPGLCSRLAPLLVDEDRGLAARLYLRVAQASPQTPAGRQAAQQARMLFEKLHDHAALDLLDASFASSPASSPASSSSASSSSSSASSSSSSTPPLVVHDAAVRADGLLLEVPAPRLVRFDEVAVVGAAAVAGARCVDLITHGGERFRLAPTALAGVAGGDVDDTRLAALLVRLLEKTHARPWPSRPALAQATWPRVDSIADLDALLAAHPPQGR